jgi:hypothetical protein
MDPGQPPGKGGGRTDAAMTDETGENPLGVSVKDEIPENRLSHITGNCRNLFFLDRRFTSILFMAGQPSPGSGFFCRRYHRGCGFFSYLSCRAGDRIFFGSCHGAPARPSSVAFRIHRILPGADGHYLFPVSSDGSRHAGVDLVAENSEYGQSGRICQPSGIMDHRPFEAACGTRPSLRGNGVCRHVQCIQRPEQRDHRKSDRLL